MANKQTKHFYEINSEYEKHYYSESSLFWRRINFWDFVLDGKYIKTSHIAEFCCGDGYNLDFLKSRLGPQTAHGYDISKIAIRKMSEKFGLKGFVFDLTKPLDLQKKYETIFVVGGLHHCITDLDCAVQNCRNALMDGGHLVVWEPYSGSIMNKLRNIWYKRDKYFEETTERAIHIDEIVKHGFEIEKIKFSGGLGYYLVGNSMIFRLPLILVSWISRPLTFFDLYFDKILPRIFSAVFFAVLKKV